MFDSLKVITIKSTDIKHKNQFVESSSKRLLNLPWNEYIQVVCPIALLQHNTTKWRPYLVVFSLGIEIVRCSPLSYKIIEARWGFASNDIIHSE